MLNVRSSHPVFRKIFLKFSGKHLWYSPNISKILNRPPENRFNNCQYATHIEQLIDAVDNLCACIFCTKMDFLPLPVIRKTSDYVNGALREAANGMFLSFFLGSSNR